MEFRFQTQLPPLNSDLYKETSKNTICQSQIKSIEAKKIQNGIGSKLNYANKTNIDTIRTKTSNVLSTISSIKPEVVHLQRQDSTFNEDISSIKSDIEKINANLFQTHANADLCQIKLDLGICQKVSQRFRELSADISNISKRVDSSEAKLYKNEQKIKEKLEKIKISLELKQSEAIKSDNTRIYAKIDRVMAFIQNAQLGFVFKFIKSNNDNHNNTVKFINDNNNLIEEIDNKIQIYQSRIEKQIQDIQHKIDIGETKLSNSQKFLNFFNKQNMDMILKINENRENSEKLENQLEARLASIEKMLDLLTKSINKSVLDYKINVIGDNSVDSIAEISKNEIKELTNDWELFHKNNLTVQTQIYDIIDNFEDVISKNGSFLNRIESAEKLVDYCIERISKWKLEEQEKIELYVYEDLLIKRMKEFEEKVRIAENKIHQIDGKKIKGKRFKYHLKKEFKIPVPPPLPSKKDDIKPFYIEDQYILTYNQDHFDGDNGLILYDEHPESPPDTITNPKDEVEEDEEDDEEEEEEEEEKKEEEEEEKKEEEEKNEKPSNLPPNYYSRFKIKRRDKRLSNRCYIPFRPKKKGETLNF